MSWFVASILALSFNAEQVTEHRAVLAAVDGVYAMHDCTTTVRLHVGYHPAAPARYEVIDTCAARVRAVTLYAATRGDLSAADLVVALEVVRRE